MLIGPLHVFFGEMSIKVFCPLFDELFVFSALKLYVLLCILEIKLLSVVSFANIFSHSVGCLFVLFMISFVVQKFVSLIRSHMFSFVFISIALGD